VSAGGRRDVAALTAPPVRPADAAASVPAQD